VRRDSIYFKAVRYLKALKKTWANNSKAPVSALGDEEVKLRREEALRQIVNQKPNESPT
jgi:hypothetical protein